MTGNINLENNPLLKTDGIPRFDRIEPDHVVPAVRHILEQAEKCVRKLEENREPTWEGLLKPLEDLDIPFEYAWGPVGHFLGVKNSDELRKAHETVLGEVVAFSLRLQQSQSVYQGLKTIRQGDEWNKLDPAQRRVVELKLRDAEHAGVGLEGEEKKRFNEIAEELSQLNTDFANHVLDATKAFSLTIDDEEKTLGWPQTLKQIAAQSYNQANPDNETEATPDRGPWRITLDIPSYLPFMQHSRQRDQREKLYHAFVTRASHDELDNSGLIERILELRAEKSKLLGFDTFARLSLDSKMAPDVAAVENMFAELQTAAKSHAWKDFGDLKLLAVQAGQTEPLAHWDMAFWSERLREQRFDYTDDQLRPYFQLPKVIDGLFLLAKKLFGIVIEPENENAPVWNPDVRYFKVCSETDGRRIASFFLDPYSRPQDKRGGAWMDDCLGRRRIDGELRLPTVHLVCNGTPPIGDCPSLMSFTEVETLFHEFGHGLQGMLTTVDYTDVAGVNGIEWDAVELPSQFMENWCYHGPTLLGMTAHVETGEPLPEDLFDKVRSARIFQSGLMTMRQLLFGMVDMHLHHRPDSGKNESAVEMYRRIVGQMSVLAPYEHDRTLCSFSHIFAGGYAAGYYSYKWAEVLSADAFAAFEEAGLDNEEAIVKLGGIFRDSVLSQGGSRTPMEIFKEFRGREPTTAALLRHGGLVGDNTG